MEEELEERVEKELEEKVKEGLKEKMEEELEEKVNQVFSPLLLSAPYSIIIRCNYLHIS